MDQFKVLISWDGRSDIAPCLHSINADLGSRDNWEIVLILDGFLAEDSFRQLSIDFSVVVIVSNIRQGLTRCLNMALRQIESSVVVRMDADDLWLKGRAELTENAFCRDEKADVFASAALFVDSVGRKKLVLPKLLQRSFDSALIHPAVAFRSVIANENVFYDEDFRLAQDYEMFNRLYFSGACFIYSHIPVIEYAAINNRRKRMTQLSYLMLANAKFFLEGRIGGFSFILRSIYFTLKIVFHSIKLMLEHRSD